MSEFFRKVLYGNERKQDFTEANLPATRREQFTYVIKTRWLKLLTVNFGVLLFFIPLLFWRIICLSYGSAFGKITVENVSGYIQYVVAYKSVPRAVFIGGAALGIAGGFHAVRMIVWGEPIGTLRAFFRGIKYSWLQYFLGGIVYGVFCGIVEIAEALVASGSLSDRMMSVLAFGGLVISRVLIMSVGMFALALVSNYNMKMLHCIKSSILLAIQTLFKTLKFLIISLLPSVIWFLTGNIYMEIIGQLILIVCGFVYSLLVWCLYTNSIFDRYINLKSYPDYYRKGLQKGEMDHA